MFRETQAIMIEDTEDEERRKFDSMLDQAQSQTEKKRYNSSLEAF